MTIEEIERELANCEAIIADPWEYIESPTELPWVKKLAAALTRLNAAKHLDRGGELIADLEADKQRLIRERDEARATVQDQAGILLRIAAHITPIRDANNEEQHAHDMADTMRCVQELDEIVNSRVCDLECETAHANQRNEAVERKLAEVRALPDQWQAAAREAEFNNQSGARRAYQKCADELTTLIQEQPND